MRSDGWVEKRLWRRPDSETGPGKTWERIYENPLYPGKKMTVTCVLKERMDGKGLTPRRMVTVSDGAGKGKAIPFESIKAANSYCMKTAGYDQEDVDLFLQCCIEDSRTEFKRQRKEYQRKWREENRDKWNSYSKKWRDAHPGWQKEYEEAWRNLNRAKTRKYSQKYRDTHKEHVRAYNHEYYLRRKAKRIKEASNESD